MAESKRRMSPPLTESLINGSVRTLLDALCVRCEHLSKPTLAVAVAKLKWTQAYGQYGTRTNAFDPDGDPLRFSNTIDSWLHAVDFRNSGVGNWNYFNRNAESSGAPSAVIILGNPKYVKGNTDAKKFYQDVRGFLEKQGYTVSFDEGKPLTSPDPADLWVGHSRGADRLKYAPPGTLTVALGVPGGVSHPKDNSLELKGPPPPDYAPNRYHFSFTSDMRSALKMKKTAKHDPSRNEYQKKYQKNRYHDRKKQAIKMLGGKCTVCGTTRSLELDHKDPDKKSFNVTKLWSVPEEEFKREVRKCKLLCSKHHRERTSKQRENGEVKSIPGKTQYDSKGRKTKSRKNKTAAMYYRVLDLQLLRMELRAAATGVGSDLRKSMAGVVISSFKKVVGPLGSVKGAGIGQLSRYGFLTTQSLVKLIRGHKRGTPIAWASDYIPKLNAIAKSDSGVQSEVAALLHQLFRWLKKMVGGMLGAEGQKPPKELWGLLTKMKDGADRAVQEADRIAKLQPLHQNEIGFVLQKRRGGFSGFNLWNSVPIGHDSPFFKKFKVRDRGKLPGWKFFLEDKKGKRSELAYTSNWAAGSIGVNEYNLAASGMFKSHSSNMWKTLYVQPGQAGYSAGDLPAPEASPSSEDLLMEKETLLRDNPNAEKDYDKRKPLKRRRKKKPSSATGVPRGRLPRGLRSRVMSEDDMSQVMDAYNASTIKPAEAKGYLSKLDLSGITTYSEAKKFQKEVLFPALDKAVEKGDSFAYRRNYRRYKTAWASYLQAFAATLRKLGPLSDAEPKAA